MTAEASPPNGPPSPDRLRQLPNWAKIAILAASLIAVFVLLKLFTSKGEQQIRDAERAAYELCLSEEKLAASVRAQAAADSGLTIEPTVSPEAIAACREKWLTR